MLGERRDPSIRAPVSGENGPDRKLSRQFRRPTMYADKTTGSGDRCNNRSVTRQTLIVSVIDQEWVCFRV